MDEEGDYVLAFLAAGTYDLVVTGYNRADFGEILGLILGEGGLQLSV